MHQLVNWTVLLQMIKSRETSHLINNFQTLCIFLIIIGNICSSYMYTPLQLTCIKAISCYLSSQVKLFISYTLHNVPIET